MVWPRLLDRLLFDPRTRERPPSQEDVRALREAMTRDDPALAMVRRVVHDGLNFLTGERLEEGHERRQQLREAAAREARFWRAQGYQ